MKLSLSLLLILSSLNALADFWEPTEKDLSSLMGRTLKTPEALLEKKFKNIEQISVGRLHISEDFSCSGEGACKYAASRAQNYPHKNLTF
jgi:hypothetical protein